MGVLFHCNYFEAQAIYINNIFYGYGRLKYSFNTTSPSADRRVVSECHASRVRGLDAVHNETMFPRGVEAWSRRRSRRKTTDRDTHLYQLEFRSVGSWRYTGWGEEGELKAYEAVTLLLTVVRSLWEGGWPHTVSSGDETGFVLMVHVTLLCFPRWRQ